MSNTHKVSRNAVATIEVAREYVEALTGLQFSLDPVSNYCGDAMGSSLLEFRSVYDNVNSNKLISTITKTLKHWNGTPAKFETYTDHNGTQMTWDFGKCRVLVVDRFDGEFKVGVLQFN